MRRRAPAAPSSVVDEHAQDWAPSSERRAKESKREPIRSLPRRLVAHPLFGLVLFLIIFPGWAAVSRLRQLCAAGDVWLCEHNNPQPFLERDLPPSVDQAYRPNWRSDERCGSKFPAPSSHSASVCNPFAKQHCCSQWGWCGRGPDFCAQAVKPPWNITGTALEKFTADLQQRRSGIPSTFQSAHEEALLPITKNYTDLSTALKGGKALSSQQEVIIHSAITISNSQLERFACCAPLQAPFLISASGHWTQDSRLTAEYLKQLVSTYVYKPDQKSTKPFWQRIFGVRHLLATASPSPLSVQRQHVGRGRFWSGQETGQENSDQSPTLHSSTTSAQFWPNIRPTLTRQNAFKLSEEQSQALTQQLGLTNASSRPRFHSASGHDLLAASSAAAAKDDVILPASSVAAANDGNVLPASFAAAAIDDVILPASSAAVVNDGDEIQHWPGSTIDLSKVLAGAKALSEGHLPQGTESQSRALQPDLHRPFNATSAYANITRCNTRRWLALHNSGTNLSLPRLTASGKMAQPPGRVTPAPLESQGYKDTPLTTFQGSIVDSEGAAQVLVVYHYYESLSMCEEDEEVQLIRANLLSFLRFAVREHDGADYVISLGGRVSHSLLDLIPPYCNVRLRFVDNTTLHSDLCTFQKALLEFGSSLLRRYKYFVVINNGMRGPFAAASQGHEKQHWTQPFIDKLDNHVKLVGPYLSCEIQVHLQGPFLVTDRVGIRYLLDTWGGCYTDHQTDIERGEVGLSQALLADGYNLASLQHEYAGIDWRRQPDRLQCKGRLPGANPTFCCDVPDPLQLHWVKYGGNVYRLGLIPPQLIRMVEDMTKRTMDLTPPLIPNGSHWHLPHPDWALQQQQAAKQQIKTVPLWRQIIQAPGRFLGLVGDGFQGKETSEGNSDWTLVKRIDALLEAVPADTQQAANDFSCNNRDETQGRGIMGWMTDAALKFNSKSITVQSSSSGR